MDANTEIAPTALAEPAEVPEPPALVASAVGKRYGSVVALEGVSLSVGQGELVGLVGANGAGKSTLVKISCGLVRPNSGTVTICGAPAGSRDARRQLGYLAELFRFPGWCSASEVLALHQRLAGSPRGKAERDELLELVGLSDVAGRRVEGMSKGMQQRLGIAQALIGEPRLLLLDEPTSALDPAGRRAIRALLLELRDRGIAVLINSHLLGELERVCDRVAILAHGRLVADGRPHELTQSGGVEIQTGTGTRRFPTAGRDDIPGIIAGLVAEGVDIYEVTLVRSTLEDAYLEAVGPE
jgi:ABC-2 type transport system ATP-binding protein